MEKISKFVQGVFAAILGLGVLVNGFHFSSLFFAAAAVLMIPIPVIREALNKCKIKNGIAVILAVLIFFVGIGCSASSDPGDKLPPEDVPISESVGDKTSSDTSIQDRADVGTGIAVAVDPAAVPAYSGTAYAVIADNQPNFSKNELASKGYEKYSSLDRLGRCGVALASCGTDIMPDADEQRGNISGLKPSGWVQAKYKEVSDEYLWNRCHLIGWQLSGENANPKNLITGTNYMNHEGMLPFENMIADYIKETKNHVAYRVTPIFEGNNLVCSGVQMEAFSVEDQGEGICFNVYCYNVQPGIKIDYLTGESTGTTDANANSKSNKQTKANNQPAANDVEMVWVTSSGRGKNFHSDPHCSGMKNPNKIPRTEAERQGKTPCSNCY